MTPRCPGSSETGLGCIYRLKPGETHCYNHDPARAAERAAASRLARARKQGDLGSELGSFDGIARRAAKVLELLEKGEEKGIEPKMATARLNALRLLAALVRVRQAGGVTKEQAENAGYSSAEDLVG